jgi:hypothetical protein
MAVYEVVCQVNNFSYNKNELDKTCLRVIMNIQKEHMF